MKLIIKKDILVNSLENVSRALSTRNIIPVLNGIKFELTKKCLKLTASDNDISIEITIDKKDINIIEEEGTVIIANGRILLELLKDLSNACEITIENYDDNEIIFKSGKFVYKSNCFSKDDYPNIKFEESSSPIKLDCIKFKEIISKTSFACSNQESRPLLTGVNLKMIGNIFECVATDSYRLSKVQIILDNKSDNNFNIVIPSRNINELYKIMNIDTEIELHVFNNKVLFNIDNIKFQTSLLNGTYPNTDNSIPVEFKNKIKVNLKDILIKVNSASKVAQAKEKNIIEMEIINNELNIRSFNTDAGKYEDSIEIDNLTKNNLKISYSARYMLDALKTFDGEFILILLNGEISPIILKDENNNELIQLILPMKTF